MAGGSWGRTVLLTEPEHLNGLGVGGLDGWMAVVGFWNWIDEI